MTGDVVVVILLLLAVDCVLSVDPSKQSRIQPAEGKCQELKWGGDTGAHWFSCCNNCKNGIGDPKCDGETWQSATNNSYCGRCGVVKKRGGGKGRGGEFSCGGCDGQQEIKQACKKWWRKIPGFCWSFSKCFHRRCVKRFDPDDSDQSPESCYNGVCEKGETPDNCPTDCCSRLNSDCDWGNNNGLCVPDCCGEVGCCLSSEGKDKYKQELYPIVVVR